MNKLTTIAALPQAGGCMSALPAEVGEENPWAKHIRQLRETKRRMELYGCEVKEIVFLDEEPSE